MQHVIIADSCVLRKELAELVATILQARGMPFRNLKQGASSYASTINRRPRVGHRQPHCTNPLARCMCCTRTGMLQQRIRICGGVRRGGAFANGACRACGEQRGDSLVAERGVVEDDGPCDSNGCSEQQ